MRTAGWWVVLVLAGCGGSSLPASPLTGVWRSIEAELRLTEQGGTIVYGCANGTINQPVRPDARGEFRVTGTYTQGYPVEGPGVPPREVKPGVYSGKVVGDTLVFGFEFADGNKNGNITVVRDGRQNVLFCA
ncbi:MAG: hypothetical protein SFU83_11535 [Meiothermus sp.]|nr:hypothetical protein [Meiothermus sp.]